MLAKLQELNPWIGGRRKHRHFQHFSEGAGGLKLQHHFGRLDGLMSISQDWDSFKQHLDKAARVIEDAIRWLEQQKKKRSEK